MYYKEVVDPTDHMRVTRVPKANYVYVTPNIGPNSGKGRYFHKAAYVSMLSFLRKAGVTHADAYTVVGIPTVNAIVIGVLDHALGPAGAAMQA